MTHEPRSYRACDLFGAGLRLAGSYIRGGLLAEAGLTRGLLRGLELPGRIAVSLADLVRKASAGVASTHRFLSRTEAVLQNYFRAATGHLRADCI